ncbi:hypothetical protein COLO4_29519 [Corchorus olitorius]|uniref:Myb/SANT-like domain-containing protein n=1 Tax=Corchorus olitorius TaxID=93759 RepID=A0A1R3HEC7_9ROSI|nr:hypothetical protein COLO4_29519 [Corchorus olitorius]
MDQYFLELMLEHVNKGNKVGRTFKKTAWVRMITLFNAKFGFQHSRAVLKNRYKILRSQYASIKALLTLKGFCWDETQKMVIADDRVWNKYIKEHPEFRRYKNKSMPCYDDMCIICRNESVSVKKRTLQCNMSSKSGASGKDIGGRSMATINVKVAEKVHIGPPPGFSSKVQEQRNKRQSQRPRTSHQAKRARTEEDGMANALRQMAFVVTSIKKKKENDNASTERVIEELQAIPGIDDDLLLDACDFLEDDRRARMFLALDVSLRKKWLMRKLRPQ